MKPTKETILQSLKELKPALYEKGIVEIALFGSYATDKATVYSDIDIAIRKNPGFVDRNRVWAYFDLLRSIESLLRRKFHRKIDIFDLDSDSPFKVHIEKELIYV